MELSYGQIEGLLMALHEIAPEQRGALKARIKHFQRNDWPGGTNTGPGRPARYGFGEMLKLCLGFEMVQLALTPERATGVLSKHWDYIREAVGNAVSDMPPPDADRSQDIYLTFDPGGLTRLTTSASEDQAGGTLFATSATQLAEDFKVHTRRNMRRQAMIDLTELIEDIAEHLAEVGIPTDTLMSDAHEWARDA